MREAHAHIFQLGRSLTMLDCSACVSREAMIEAIAEHSRMLRPDQWVLAHSARPEAWPDPTWPTRHELDKASDHRPVCAWCFDYHALVGSTTALEHAGIDQHSKIDRGIIEVGDDGTPTGVLYEHAALALWNAVPEPDAESRRSVVLSACHHLESLGFNEAHDLKSQPWLGPLLAQLRDERQTTLSFQLFPLIPDLKASLDSRAEWESDDLKLAGTKIFTDGTLNSRTAWMLDPYTDTGTTGTPMMTHDEIDESMLLSKSHGLPVAAHAIGDGAVRAVLDSIERTQCTNFGARIEHLELVHADDIPRFHELGVIASVQPCHLLPDVESLRACLSDRLDRVLPLRSLLESGLIAGESMLFGSDVPIVRANHEDSVQAAVHRRRDDMDESDAIGIDQRLTEREAMSCFG
jgi:predicted amidohydrolase YtcJ